MIKSQLIRLSTYFFIAQSYAMLGLHEEYQLNGFAKNNDDGKALYSAHIPCYDDAPTTEIALFFYTDYQKIERIKAGTIDATTLFPIKEKTVVKFKSEIFVFKYIYWITAKEKEQKELEAEFNHIIVPQSDTPKETSSLFGSCKLKSMQKPRTSSLKIDKVPVSPRFISTKTR